MSTHRRKPAPRPVPAAAEPQEPQQTRATPQAETEAAPETTAAEIEAVPGAEVAPDGGAVDSAPGVPEPRPPAQRESDAEPRHAEAVGSERLEAMRSERLEAMRSEPRHAEPAEPKAAGPGVAEPDVAESDVAEPVPPAEADQVAAEPGPDPDADEPAAGESSEGSQTVRRSRRSMIRSAVIVASLCGILGFALAAQLRSNEGESQFANARQSDLVRILDELDSREDRLRGEIADLEFRRETISSRAQGSEAALSDARRRTTELGILAGTVAAEGPGLMITLTEKPGEQLSASTILDTVEELRGAGAEAMQIAGKEGAVVRIGVSTYFVDAGEGIEVDGKRMAGPYVITVIGDPPTMESALRIPGGIVETVNQDGGNAVLAQSRTVRINAVRQLREPKFARPAS